jgi:23S rRNA (uridine2552-2'-O)-methyltransferase
MELHAEVAFGHPHPIDGELIDFTSNRDYNQPLLTATDRNLVRFGSERILPGPRAVGNWTAPQGTADMKRPSAKQNRWQDHYARKAKQERYPARSVYKLEGIQKKFAVIRKGARVLDLGCSPGSWLLYAARLVGPAGSVVGIDLKPVIVRLPLNAEVMTGDACNIGAELSQRIGYGYHAVISDMAPSTTGHKGVDALRSVALCEAALAVAGERLAVGGNFVCKIFQGEDFMSFLSQVRGKFETCKAFKPEATRKASRETYIIGLGKIQEVEHVGS